ncbi:MAG TPA: GspMb/PilO family protein [Blastocatellia bacterium]|nr:GspMb/PilO family protein [Blastocatellia bacterium]
MTSYVRERLFRQEIGAQPHVSKPFGLSAGELVAAFLTLAFFVVVICYYFTSLKPEQDRLARLEAQLREQQAQIIGEAGKPKEDASERLSKIQETLSTLETFRTEHLKNRSQGIITLFNDFNAIAAKNSVRLMSGIDMRDEGSGPTPERNASRSGEAILDQFPSVKIDFTVAGEYQNLRNFISDLERNKQFIIIDSIQLITVAEPAGGRGGQRRTQAGGVALSIGLTAYFQE